LCVLLLAIFKKHKKLDNTAALYSGVSSLEKKGVCCGRTAFDITFQHKATLSQD